MVTLSLQQNEYGGRILNQEFRSKKKKKTHN